MRFHLLPTLLLLAQCCSPTRAYMQQRPVENAPGPEDVTNGRGGANSCEENDCDAPIPALESEPQKQREVVQDRERKAENASKNEGECATEDVVDEAVVIDEISDTEFGVAQDITGHDAAALLTESKVYISTTVNVDPQYATVRADCRNQDALCTFWATLGECDGNPAYMKLHCAPACLSCEQLDINVRCPMDPNAKDALGPRELDALFERIVSDPFYEQYQPTIISRPSHPPGSTDAEVMDANYTIGPWMVTFDTFLTSEEADSFIQLGAEEGYARSTDVGKKQFDGTYDDHRSSQRTSENSWCQHECYDNPVTQTVLDRIENLTGIPDENSEYLQLLKYEEGQFYGVHNDFIRYQVDRPVGPRILTFYMYLNDVEEGGGTRFPRVGDELGGTAGTTVFPKRGRAVLWPSILNDDPNAKDCRTEHEALPVIQGVKYGANAWIHNRNYKGPNDVGCG